MSNLNLECVSGVVRYASGGHVIWSRICPTRKGEGCNNALHRLKEMAAELDLQVICDLSWDGEEHPVIYLGRRVDLSAGLYGFVATPIKRSPEELEAWCKENWGKLAVEYGLE